MLLDVVIYDRNGQIVLIGEVKNKLNTTSTWAARMRRNIFAHGYLPPTTPYFLIALPDRLYLWKDVLSTVGVVKPDLDLDASTAFQPYFDSLDLDPKNLSGQALELVVIAWLTNLIMSTVSDLPSQEHWIVQTGLLEAIRGGCLEHEVSI